MESPCALHDNRSPREVLSQILEWVEEHLDLNHCYRVEELHRRTARWESTSHSPVTIAAPAIGLFPYYPYGEAFRDPAKMLVNELVDASAGLIPIPSVVNSVLMKDDFPLQIRANYGVGLVASMFGGRVEVVEDNMPWTRPIGPERIPDLLASGIPDLDQGLCPRVVDTMAYYRETLAPFPKCSAAIHVTQPDLQGPFDIATQLWGGGVLTAFYDQADLLQEFLTLISDTYVSVCQGVSAHSTQLSQDNSFIYLHSSEIRGRCLLKDDSATLVSPSIYSEFIRPANERILTALGGGGIHWCGSGDHWREEFVGTRGLSSLDMFQPHLVDLDAWSGSLRASGVCVSRMNLTAKTYHDLRVTERFPTGAAFVVSVESLEEGRRILANRGRSCSNNTFGCPRDGR